VKPQIQVSYQPGLESVSTYEEHAEGVADAFHEELIILEVFIVQA